MHKIIPTLFFFISYLSLSAQLNKTLYQTFEVKEYDIIELDLVGDVKIETWAGTALMVETNVDLYSSTHKMLKYFVESGRYKVDLKPEKKHLKLESKDKVRKQVRTENGLTEEIVTLKIYVPDVFKIVGKNKFVRKNGEEENQE